MKFKTREYKDEDEIILPKKKKEKVVKIKDENKSEIVENFLTYWEITIPNYVKEEIKERWFYVHNWIDKEELKIAIQIHFLKSLYVFWPLGIVVFAIMYILFKNIWFLFAFWIISALMTIYLIFVSIYLVLRASKISHLVLTKTHFSFGKEIFPLNEEWKAVVSWEIVDLSEEFMELPFDENKLETAREKKKEETMELFTKWQDVILEHLSVGQSRDADKLIAFVFIASLLFAISVAIMYFIWVAVTVVVGFFLNFLITQYYVMRWNTIVKITEWFKKIETSSMEVKEEKENTLGRLEEAFNEEWKDWLLLKLNDWFSFISKRINFSLEESWKLVENIKKSIYKEMFDEKLYNSWLKKQTREPIDWIIVVLENNLRKIEKAIEEIWETNVWQIELAKERLEMKKKELEYHIGTMVELRKKI